MSTVWTQGPNHGHNVYVIEDGDTTVPGNDWTQWDTIEEAIEGWSIQAGLYIVQARAQLAADTTSFTLEQRIARLEAAILGV